MPSSNVDLPQPFSPARTVTGAVSRSEDSARITGTLNGYMFLAAPAGVSRVTALRWIFMRGGYPTTNILPKQTRRASPAAGFRKLGISVPYSPYIKNHSPLNSTFATGRQEAASAVQVAPVTPGTTHPYMRRSLKRGADALDDWFSIKLKD